MKNGTEMRTSGRYTLLGALAGLLAPGALFLFATLSKRALDPFWLSVLLAAGGTTVFALLGRMIGLRDERLEDLSETDALTKVANRRAFDRRLSLELSRTKRYGMTSALVMIDLDHFKAINDHFGHRAGDEILRRLGGLLDSERRAGDLVARYGGEEFVAILPHTTIADATNWAERVRQYLAASRTAWKDADIAVTASFGVAGASSWSVSNEQLIEAADQALYEAKRRGGNVVVDRLPDAGGGADRNPESPARRRPNLVSLTPGRASL